MVDNFISRFLLQTVESYQEDGLGEQLTHGHRTQQGSQCGRKSCLIFLVQGTDAI